MRLRAAVRERVGLPVTVGVARTKFLAKVASGVAKPDGLLAVPPERELAFLHPLPVECVWGVGPATAKRLQAWNVRTVGELAALSESTLVAMLGRAAGRQLNALAHNRDFRRVEPGTAARLDRLAARARARATLGRGDRRDARRHRRPDHAADADGAAGRRTVVLRLRFGDFERATRSHTLPFATANTQAILVTARALLATATPLIEQRGITLVGCSVAMLEDARTRQLLLGPEEALDAAVDAIRDRYGSAAITRAVLLGRDPGFSMPLLPD